MKMICIGDIHASGFNDDPLVDGLPARLSYIRKTLNYIVNYGKEHGISEYVILGDLIHDKTIIYNIAQSMLYSFFKENSSSHFYIISGNHDLSSTGDNQKSACEVFGALDNVTYCGEWYYGKSIKALFVSFTNDFIGRIKNLDFKQDVNILFSHIGLNEAVLQSGLSKVDKLTLNDLKDFKLAILGHYHKPQKLSNGHTNVWYAGSIIPRDWNDKNEFKRFLVLDTDTLDVEDVPLNVDNVPMYYELVIHPDTTEEDTQKIILNAKALRKSGHHVRVINKCQTKIKDEEVTKDVVVIEQQQVDITNRGITVDQSKMEQCKKYLEIKLIPESERDKYIQILQDNKLLEVTEE